MASFLIRLSSGPTANLFVRPPQGFRSGNHFPDRDPSSVCVTKLLSKMVSVKTNFNTGLALSTVVEMRGGHRVPQLHKCSRRRRITTKCPGASWAGRNRSRGTAIDNAATRRIRRTRGPRCD